MTDRAHGADPAGWQPTRRSDLFDLALAAVLGVAAAVSLHIGGAPVLFASTPDSWRPAGIARVTLCIAPLAVRRRFPLTVLAVTTAAFLPVQVLEVPEVKVSPVGIFIALYTAGAYGRLHRDLVRSL